MLKINRLTIQFLFKYKFHFSLLSWVVFLCLQGNAQLRADFTATPVKGCAPLVVQFTDISIGSPTSWFWDLGNGNTSISQNPGAIYFTPGTYTVKLVVKNATNKDSVIRVGYISVSDKPVINFSADDTIGCTPHQVVFTDLSAAGTGTISQWQWDFGDGNTSTVQSPSNLFVSAGSYNITLNVVNSGGCNNTITKSGYIKVIQSPFAGFTTASSTTCSPPVTVNFTNTSSGSNIINYKWDFGDGATSTSINPTHSFTTTGVFNTQLVVTNQSGCTNTVSKLISIGAVVPNFNNPDTVCVNTGFNIFNTSTPATVSAFWTFGDGTTSTQTNPYKIYNTAGTYNIKLVNNFGACKDSIAKKIVVLNAPLATFTYNAPPPGCTVPITVSFNATTTAFSYLWDFGDGNTSTIQSPTHVYTTIGTYSVKLFAKNAYGCADSIVKSNIISISLPKINSIGGLPYKGCLPFSLTFIPNITTPEPVTTYKWDFGDNTFSSSPNPSHTYNTTGTYNVSLIIITNNGCTDTFLLPQAVTVGTKPTVNFTASPLIACGYQNIKFTNTSIGQTTAWFWSFGDTAYSGLQNPTHLYNDTGFFSILFVAENNGCIDSIKKTNYVYIKPPIALYSVKHYCDTPLLKKFVNKSKGALSYLWDFGDGSTSTLSDPIHTYAARGSYLVKLRVDNAPCYDFFEDSVYVVDEYPAINISPAIVCKNGPVLISCTNINSTNISQYLWDFGDTTMPFSTFSPQITHSYTTSGTYNITLKTTDILGCIKIVTKTNGITVYGPTAKVTHASGACINSNVKFTDQSTAYPGYPIVSWTIDYGDGSVSTSASPVFNHIYNNTGTYTINYKIKDSYGCIDSLIDSAAIIITKVTVGFLPSDTLACRQSLINFTNTSVGSTLAYKWDFGDGGTSTLRSPAHLYTSNGIYNVQLKITDRFGCKDSVRKDSVIVIGNAVADFTLSDTIVNCPPAQILFTNKSTFFSSIKWDFDNGSTSTLNNPTHIYVVGGLYNVKLVVNGFGSCIDSMIKRIRVKGPQGNISYNPKGKCVPATINFNATASNISSNFIWDFGDGTTLISGGNTVTHTYATVGRYLPKLLLRDTTINCIVFVFGSDSISVSNVSAIIKRPVALFCDSTTITFTDSSVIKFDTVSLYKWSFGDGGTSNSQNPVHTYSSPGNYTINMNLQTIFGCKDTAAPVFIKVVKGPVISVSGNPTSCVNSPINFALTQAMPDTSFTKYKWTFGNGNTSTLAIPPSQIYTTPNSYIINVVAVNSSGCTDTVNKSLTVFPLPNVDAGSDSTICRGQTITLLPGGALSYTWQTNGSLSCSACTNPLAKPDSTIKYFVTGKSIEGCTNKDSIKVSVIQPFRIITSIRDTICRGEATRLLASGTDTYTWSPSAGLSNVNIANPSAKPDTSTIYRVIGSDQQNCFKDTGYVPVIVYNKPIFNIIPDVLNIPAGSSVTITTNGSADINAYNWSPSTGLSCNNCPQPTATPAANSTTYTAIASNAGGCTATDQVTINMLCGSGNIFIPNTFSPNGDGSNDIFYPRGKGIKGVKNMIIYNRWGAVVFQRGNFDINNQNAGWDGSYKGQPAPSEVYVYHLEIICGTGNQFLYKGDVTLVR